MTRPRRFDFSIGRRDLPDPTLAKPVEPMIDPDALEVKLSKGWAEKLVREGTMQQFLAELGRWAERKGTEGYTIASEPDEGPGTMVWRAKR